MSSCWKRGFCVGFCRVACTQNRYSPPPPIRQSALQGAPPGRRRRGGAVWCAARPRRRTNARERRRTRRQSHHVRNCSISKARSVDLEVTPRAPSRLTSCISHPGPAEAYELFRSTLCSARAPFHHLAAPESTRKPASAAHSRHFAGQKLRLGGDALGADPTYLLYLPFRSHEGI